MTKVSEAFPSNYIKCADLNEKPHQLMMAYVEIEKIGDDKRPVLYFKGAKKGLVLNKTNANNIADLYGDDMDEWTGQTVVLFPATTDFQGKTVDCIRVRGPKPAAKGVKKTPPKEENENPAAGVGELIDDEIPF
jgi:hypothetical protein